MTNDTKHCKACNTTQSVGCFSKSRGTRDGLDAQCKGCKKAYRQGNRERISEYRKTYLETNRERTLECMKAYNQAKRALMTNTEKAARDSVNLARTRSDLPSEELYGGLTWFEACEMTLPFVELRFELERETGAAYNIDHVIPVKAGGTHTANNLQVISASDNFSKIAEDKRLVEEYRELELNAGE